MAITSAQLTAAITSSQLQFNLSNISGTGLPTVGATPLSVGSPMMIDSEIMFAVSQPVAGTVVVRNRGSEGTAAVAHDILANVYTTPTPVDFGAIPTGITVTVDPTDDVVISIGQDGAIPLPASNTVYNINKATAAALTLAAPPLNENGTTVIVTAQTAAAHVITATSLLADGSASAPKTTATFSGTKGASVSLVAENGLWHVTALQNVTIS